MKYIQLFLNNPYLSILIVGSIMLLVQLYYYLYYYMRIFAASKKKEEESHLPPLSVIICARNEEENLRQHLPLILGQAYPNFEVIVVDDCSTDNTELVLKQMEQQHKHFRYTKINQDQKFSHGKKLALTVGIKSARHNWLVHTDADCKPAGTQWLRTLSTRMKPGKELILGYGGYTKDKGMLNSLIRFETIMIALQYITFAAARKPYMGVGRNLAYTKDLFFKNKGFASHYHIASGDDDLFVQQAANQQNTAICIDPEAFTFSVPKSSFAEWKNQKQRHFTTASHYKKSVRRRLAWEPFSRLGLWITLALSLIWHPQWALYIASAAATRWLFQAIVYAKVTRQLGEKKLFLPAMCYDILIPFLYFYFWVHNLLSAKSNQWK